MRLRTELKDTLKQEDVVVLRCEAPTAHSTTSLLLQVHETLQPRFEGKSEHDGQGEHGDSPVQSSP